MGWADHAPQRVNKTSTWLQHDELLSFQTMRTVGYEEKYVKSSGEPLLSFRVDMFVSIARPGELYNCMHVLVKTLRSAAALQVCCFCVRARAPWLLLRMPVQHKRYTFDLFRTDPCHGSCMVHVHFGWTKSTDLPGLAFGLKTHGNAINECTVRSQKTVLGNWNGVLVRLPYPIEDALVRDGLSQLSTALANARYGCAHAHAHVHVHVRAVVSTLRVDLHCAGYELCMR